MIPAAANPLLMKTAADDEVVTKSCRFDGGSSLTRTYTSNATWTFSAWVKRAELGATNNLLGTVIQFNSSDQLVVPGITTTAVYRDPASWYHICVSDSTLYINGDAQSGTVATSALSDAAIGSSFDGYLADVYLIDGTAKVATDFAETDSNGQWVPKAYTGSVGTEGVHLDFKDSAALGADAAGSNDFGESGIVVSDQVNDRPTNNYAVLNPLAGGTTSTFTEGNLVGTCPPTNGAVMSTIALPSTGQWYCEVEFDSMPGYAVVGVGRMGMKGWTTSQQTDAETAYIQSSTPLFDVAGSDFSLATPSGTSISIAQDTVYGVMWDADTKTFKLYDGTDTWQCVLTIPSYDIGFIFGTSSASLTGTVRVNFGQDPTLSGSVSGGAGSEFYLTKPSGYSALSTANLPTPTIAKGHKYFNTLLYDDGTGAKTFGAADNLSPDLVWVKSRGSSNNHKLTDSLRGVQKSMESDTVDAEVTESSNVGVTVFGADGFTIGSSSSTTGPYADQTGTGMVGWGWKSATAGVGGSGVNWAEQYDATAGISIVKWSGNSSVNTSGNEQTISHHDHGDTAMIIAKARTAHGVTEYMDTGGWIVWHKDLTSEDYFLTLNTTSAQSYWSSSYMKVISDITDTSIKVGNGSDYNSGNPYALNFDGSGSWTGVEDYIGYFFSEVAGYSKFGSYTGNGVVDGPFVWCGFRPAFMMARRVDYASKWQVWDNERDIDNVVARRVTADTYNAEDTGAVDVDFLSNGWKLRNTGINQGTGSYIFAAFAEKPFKYAAAR